MSNMPARESVEVDELAAQVAWVRNLALAIVCDAGRASHSTNGALNARISRATHAAGAMHAADDLAQDAWVAVLERKPDASEPLTAWFARVMRNLARYRARGDRHRLAREQ